MSHNFLKRFLSHSFKLGKVAAKILVRSTELLDLVPHFVVEVSTDALDGIGVVCEVAIVDCSVVS